MEAERIGVKVQTNPDGLGTTLDWVIFLGAAVLLLPFIVIGGAFPDLFSKASDFALDWVTSNWGWFYLASVNIFIVVVVVLALLPCGSIRLGGDDEQPEYSRLSWFAMLFSAGMGIGLVFWSVAEPLYHFMAPPIGEPNTPGAARLALAIFFHHWGIHAWAIYVAVGLPMAYFQFRQGYQGGVSSSLLPLLAREDSSGRLTMTPVGSVIAKIVDILAVWATVLGVVTSLGLGAMQIASGLSITYGLPDSFSVTAAVIIVVTLLFILSALSGVSRGIRLLSLGNVVCMLLLLAFFLLFGPQPYLLQVFFTACKDYVTNLIPLSTTFTLFGNASWTKAWTIFYWAWWIAWAPFVGAFIANISRGRTIREFVLVVMILPAIFSFMFSAALSGTSLHMQLFGDVDMMAIINASVEATLFATLQHMPMFMITALVANLLIASFFITSADSATFVLGNFTMKSMPAGARRRNPSSSSGAWCSGRWLWCSSPPGG
ncbi:MAG: BCCT family transporter [Desulfopila sp.]